MRANLTLVPSERQRDTPRNTRERKRWAYNDNDHAAWGNRFWVASRHFIEHCWPKFWRDIGPGATSLFPVIGLHVLPNGRTDSVYTTCKALGRSVPLSALHDAAEWTPWQRVSVTRLARLSGCSEPTTRRLLAALQKAGWIQVLWLPRGKGSGGLCQHLRVRMFCYATEDNAVLGGAAVKIDRGFLRVPGALFYSGAWAVLPTPAARHLWMVIASRDPLYDEPAYRAAVARMGLDPGERVANARAEVATSAAELSTLAGPSERQAREALADLAAFLPQRDSLPEPMVAVRQVGTLRAFAATTAYLRPGWSLDALNDATARRELRDAIWPRRVRERSGRHHWSASERMVGVH